MSLDFLAAIMAIPPLFLALSVHEYAHGVTALYFGDPTAKLSGRLTLNPLVHYDPIGSTMILLGVLTRFPVIGWAKPVPVNYYNLRSPKRDMALVALAGPVSNLLLGLVCAGILRFVIASPLGGQSWAGMVLSKCILINTGLAMFNLLPIFPLDGSRIMSGLLPYPYSEQYARMEPYGIWILMGLLLFGFIQYLVVPLIVPVLAVYGIVARVPMYFFFQ